MLDRVKMVFENVLKTDPRLVDENTTINTLNEWDSLKHLELMMAIEGEFGVKFQMSELVEIDSVAKILELLNSKNAAA